MKAGLSNIFIGVAIFLLGGVLHDFVGLKTLGNTLAFMGIIYAAIYAIILIAISRPIEAFNSYLVGNDEGNGNSGGIIQSRFFRTLTGALIILVIPLALHLLIFLTFSAFDPCNNNPGCMAGSMSAYFLILATVPTTGVLLLLTLFQAPNIRQKFNRYLLINMGVAGSPFVISFLFYLWVIFFPR